MYKKIARIINEYEEKKQLGDENFIVDILTILVSQYGLIDYVKNIEYPTKKNMDEDPYYDPASYTLFINKYYINEEVESINDNLRKKSRIRSNSFTYNLLLLQQILHEVDHILLEKETDDKNTNIITLLSELASNEEIVSRFNIIKKIIAEIRFYYNGHIYEQYHDLAPFERRAEITSLRAINDVLEELKNTDINNILIHGQKHLYTNKLNSAIIKHYSLLDNVTNSPSYDYMNMLLLDEDLIPDCINIYNEDEETSFILDSNTYDYNQRLLYGLQLSKDEYKNLKKC